MTRTQEKAAATAERGWEGVASGYDTAAEHLAAAVTEQRALSEHLEGAIEVLRQVDEDTSLGDVAGGLTHASCELHRARTAGDAVASSLDDARSHLAATGLTTPRPSRHGPATDRPGIVRHR